MKEGALMKRTTIMADDELLLEAKYQAQREGRSVSALVQDALREYIAVHRPKRRLASAGIANVDWSPSAEELDRVLIEGLDPIEGWSPDRSALVTGQDPQKAEAS
jgi:metal-responsive CopG/Arc/MetJ family transcriptional regulator